MKAATERLTALLLAFALGGYGVLCYLEASIEPRILRIHELRLIASDTVSITLLAYFVAQWINQKGQPRSAYISPARSGALVVVATGIAAAIFTARSFRRAEDLLLPLLILAITGGITMLVVRFAHRHEGQIGEARFKTTQHGNATKPD